MWEDSNLVCSMRPFGGHICMLQTQIVFPRTICVSLLHDHTNGIKSLVFNVSISIFLGRQKREFVKRDSSNPTPPTWKRLATISPSCRYSGRPSDRNANFHCIHTHTHTHTTQHEDLLQISNCCALIRNNTLSIVNHTLLVEAWNEKRNHTFLFEETNYHIWFQFLVLQKKRVTTNLGKLFIWNLQLLLEALFHLPQSLILSDHKEKWLSKILNLQSERSAIQFELRRL